MSATCLETVSSVAIFCRYSMQKHRVIVDLGTRQPSGWKHTAKENHVTIINRLFKITWRFWYAKHILRMYSHSKKRKCARGILFNGTKYFIGWLATCLWWARNLVAKITQCDSSVVCGVTDICWIRHSICSLLQKRQSWRGICKFYFYSVSLVVSEIRIKDNRSVNEFMRLRNFCEQWKV